MSDTTTAVAGRDVRVIGLVGIAHFFSHFYMLALPPLFPLLKAELGVSYAALGGALTLFQGASAAAQVPVGFIVDRVGARAVLGAGLALAAGAIAAIGLTGSYWALAAFMFLAGLGNSVFHPADYALLTANVADARLGRAFSLHTFAGFVGFAVAPGAMVAMASLADWRWALIIAGAGGLVLAVVIWTARGVLAPERRPPARRERSDRRVLLNPTMLGFFAFFVVAAMATGGLQTFSVSALVAIYGVPLADANLALTGFLVAGALGILAGGVLADRCARHNLVAAGGFIGAAAVVVVIAAVPLSLALLVAAFVLTGLLQGLSRPSRDMMVRAATPPGASGRVFGFVSAGLNVGGALSPLLFGWLIDAGAPRLVFWCAVGFLLVGAALAAVAGRREG